MESVSYNYSGPFFIPFTLQESESLEMKDTLKIETISWYIKVSELNSTLMEKD